MKSKRAEEYLEHMRLNEGNVKYCLEISKINGTLLSNIHQIVEISEREIQDKAIDAHIKSCLAYIKCEYTGHKLCRNKSGYDNKGVTYVDECKCKPDICTYVISFQSLINLGI